MDRPSAVELSAGDNTSIQCPEWAAEPVRLGPTTIPHTDREAPRRSHCVGEGPVEADGLGVTADLAVGRGALIGTGNDRHYWAGVTPTDGALRSQPQLAVHVVGDLVHGGGIAPDAELVGLQRTQR